MWRPFLFATEVWSLGSQEFLSFIGGVTACSVLYPPPLVSICCPGPGEDLLFQVLYVDLCCESLLVLEEDQGTLSTIRGHDSKDLQHGKVSLFEDVDVIISCPCSLSQAKASVRGYDLAK